MATPEKIQQWREDNRERYNEKVRDWKRENKQSVRALHLKRYGLTLEAYNRLLLSQGGKCAVCGRTDSGHSKQKNLSVDHCHVTGIIRGLLCNSCNVALGAAGDDPERLRALAAYLERAGN